MVRARWTSGKVLAVLLVTSLQLVSRAEHSGLPRAAALALLPV